MLKFFILSFSLLIALKISANTNFENYADTLIPGRCFYVEEPEIKTAAALVFSKENNKVLVAPLSGDDFSKNYFDHKDYVELLNKHGSVLSSLFIPIKITKNISIIEVQDRDNHFSAEMIETNRFITLKAFRNGELFRECYYALSFRK